jgi:hypothetical protein
MTGAGGGITVDLEVLLGETGLFLTGSCLVDFFGGVSTLPLLDLLGL